MTMHTIARGAALVGSRLIPFIAGCIFVAGAAAILFEDVVMRGAPIELKHILTVTVLSGTLLVGHLLIDAWHRRAAMGVIGFLILFCTGTALVVYKSSGRQAEHTFASEADAGVLAKALSDKGADLEDARQRKREAEANVDWEIKGRPDKRGRPTKKEGCGKDCQDWKKRATEIQSHIEKLEREIAELGPQKPVAPEAENIANVAAAFGGDKAKVKGLVLLVEPFIQTILFELGGLWCLGYAFRPFPRNVKNPEQPAATAAGLPTASETAQSSFPAVEDLAAMRPFFVIDGGRNLGNSGKGGNSGHRPKPGNPGNGGGKRVLSKAEALLDVTRRLASGETIEAQNDLAEAWGVNKGTVSKWFKDWRRDDLIPAAQRVGRCHRLVAAD